MEIQVKITSQADTQLNALATQINRIARKGIDGKVFAMDVASVEEQTSKFRPGGVRPDVKRTRSVSYRAKYFSRHVWRCLYNCIKP